MSKRWVLALAVTVLSACASTSARQPGLESIEQIVVIYAENRSFDHLYGGFPGAEGIAQASAEQKTQLDLDGRSLPTDSRNPTSTACGSGLRYAAEAGAEFCRAPLTKYMSIWPLPLASTLPRYSQSNSSRTRS